MERKIALAAAAAVVMTVSAGTAAVAANLGLLASTAEDTVGQLQPARDDSDATRTIVIEEVVPAGELLPAPAPTPGDDEDEEEHEEEGREEHEDDEGRDDDD